MRTLAAICSVLTVVAAAATAAALGLAMIPADGDWLFVAIAGGAAVAFGVVSVTLWRRLDD